MSTDLAAHLTNRIADLAATRDAVTATLTGQQLRFILDAIDGAIALLAQGVMTATDGQPPSDIVKAIAAAERAGNDEEALRLLQELNDSRQCIVADDFTVIAAVGPHPKTI